MNRTTTRAGRKIEHLAPGHVRDVATGVAVKHSVTDVGGLGKAEFSIGRVVGVRYRITGDEAIRCISIAAGICALVRALVEAWAGGGRRDGAAPNATMTNTTRGGGATRAKDEK